MSQAKFGSELNIGKATVSHYENCKRNIPNGLLKQFAEYFGVSIDFLLCTRDEKLDSVNAAFLINIIRNLEVQKFTTSELTEYAELMKENASQILSRRNEPLFVSILKVAETKNRNN